MVNISGRKIRTPSVAGTFYEGSREALKAQIEWAFTHKLGPGSLPKAVIKGQRKIIGLIAPHAGYMYSGPIAAHGYLQLATNGKPELFIILGPNHTGLGSGIAVDFGEDWETPLGIVRVNDEVAKKISVKSGIVDLDSLAHKYEHSIEVQLPFLQYIFGSDIAIVPITMMIQTLDAAKSIAKAIYDVEKELNLDIVVIASTDFTHYEPHTIATRKDKLVIDAILELDANKVYERVTSYNISMCGPGPVMTLIEYVKLKMSEVKVQAKLLKYATSGDITGDKSAVVGYASILFTKG